MRLIDADALKEFIDDCGICAICPQKATRCSYDCDFPDFVTEKWNVAIDAQPTIDAVSVVPGEWIDAEIRHEDGVLPIQVCSECKTFYPLEYTGGGHRFCPNCGTRMKGADDEDN